MNVTMLKIGQKRENRRGMTKAYRDLFRKRVRRVKNKSRITNKEMNS